MLSAEMSTLKIHRLSSKVPESDKEVWMPMEVAEGSGGVAVVEPKDVYILGSAFWACAAEEGSTRWLVLLFATACLDPNLRIAFG